MVFHFYGSVSSVELEGYRTHTFFVCCRHKQEFNENQLSLIELYRNLFILFQWIEESRCRKFCYFTIGEFMVVIFVIYFRKHLIRQIKIGRASCRERV